MVIRWRLACVDGRRNSVVSRWSVDEVGCEEVEDAESEIRESSSSRIRTLGKEVGKQESSQDKGERGDAADGGRC